jgi:spore coat protein CotH
MVWVALTQNGDAVAQNFYLYDAPEHGQAFWFLFPWDSNLCFGADWTDASLVVPAHDVLLVDGGNYFSMRLLQVKELRRRYLARFRQVLDDVLTEDAILDAYRPLAARVERDLAADQHRWKRKVSAREAFDVLETFFHERPDALRAALEELDEEDDQVDEDDE